MDPLSISASVASLLDLSEKLAKYAWHVKKAPEEIKDVKQTVDGLMPLLYSLEERANEAEAHPSHPWYRGLRRLDPGKNPNGPVARLKSNMEDIVQELMPNDDWKKVTQPLTWHWSREKMKSKLREVDSCCITINQVLDKDQFDVSLNIQEQGAETNENVKQVQVQGQDTNLAVKQMQELMKSMEARNEKQDEESELKLRNKIAEWLSPFRFLARQQELFEGSYPTGKWLLSSDEFKSWYRGRPWQLHLWGDAGAGKVRYLQKVHIHSRRALGFRVRVTPTAKKLHFEVPSDLMLPRVLLELATDIGVDCPLINSRASFAGVHRHSRHADHMLVLGVKGSEITHAASAAR